MLRSLKELSRGILSIQAMRGAKMAPEPGVLAMTIHTGPTCKESESENIKVTDSNVYTNKNGERVCKSVFSFLSLAYRPKQLLMHQRFNADYVQWRQSTAGLRVRAVW